MNLNNQYQTCPALMQDSRLFTDWMPHDLSYKNKMNILGVKDNDEFRNVVAFDISKIIFNPMVNKCQKINIKDGENIHKLFEENLNNILQNKTKAIYSAYEFDSLGRK